MNVEEKPNQNREETEGQVKRIYEKPQIRTEALFERAAAAQGKQLTIPEGGTCDFFSAS